ncbi:hypothetical protein [Pseudoalteromonas rubra]|uniref:hypothetical protein n=1 Tax=Pseudoalteromonas rubra TaxID=43658 RepID=UPI000F7B45A8|nr:hypothetical protein [Pseudoalteromonas rubra]
MKQSMDRVEALKEIVTFGTEKEKAHSEIIKFGYDSEEELFEVTKPILASVLNMYLTSRITEYELERWANFIECRDDLNYDLVREHIYSLANPYLVGEISREKVTEILKELIAS